MRVLGRLLKRLLQGLLVVVVIPASPVVYVETMCRGDASPAPATPLSGEVRPEIRTLLTYPEWHIVHAYDDYAVTIRDGDPHDFNFLQAIVGYWSSLCSLTEASAALGEIDGETRQLVHVIGVSFTFEMLMKAAYEETVGRIATWVRGADHAPLDDLSARQAAAYAGFLQQTPWYAYDFRADAATLSAASTGTARDRERAAALGLENRARAAYADVIARAVAATGFDDLTLQMVVAGLSPEMLEATPGVRVLRDAGAGIEVETPRYRELTGILANWADQGADFIDMAGNDQIMFTALSDASSQTGALASLSRQGHSDTRHLFLVPVADLARSLRGLGEAGCAWNTSMTIRRLVLALPVLFAGWIGTLALVMAMGGAAPAAIVPFPPADLLAALPGDVSVTGRSRISLTLRSNAPDLPARLYEAGAWLVLPAGLEACIPNFFRRQI